MTPRHVQLLRALFAAVAALMITFSPDHSHEVGLAVFGGFGIATAMVFALAAWLVAPAGHRGAPVLLGAVHLAAGMAASAVALRSETLLFVVLIAWALLAGIVELAIGITQRARLGRSESRDAVVVGGLTILLGAILIFVRPEYALTYSIEEAGAFTLTGTTIAVGLFGGYAAIVAVFLGIAGLSPAPSEPASEDLETAAAVPQEDRP
ncbi:acyl-CoA synthetase [Microbacterium lacusdiani]